MKAYLYLHSKWLINHSLAFQFYYNMNTHLYTFPLPLAFKHLHFWNNPRNLFVVTKTPERTNTTWYQPKRAETTQNDVKPTKITPIKLKNKPKRAKISKVIRSVIFYLNSFFKFLAQIPKFGHFRTKSINSILVLTKLYLYPILEVLILNLKFVFCGS